MYTREVLATIYKFKASFVSESEVWNPDPSPYAPMRTDRPVRDRRGWVFERERFENGTHAQVGNESGVKIKAYNAAITAISRAFARLEKRGMVKRRRRSMNAGPGIVLTPAGYQEALAKLKAIDPDRHQLQFQR